MKRFVVLLFFSALFFTAVMRGESAVTVEKLAGDQAQTFRDELSKVARKAYELRQSQFSIIKNINDSYRLTVTSVMLLAVKGDVNQAIPLLQLAVKKYDGNRLAYLLLGSAYEKLNRRDEAARAYGNFYRFSVTLAPSEVKLIDRSSLTIFRGYVEKRFNEWHQTLPAPKVPLGVQEVRSLMMIKESRPAQLLNLALPLTVMMGMVFLLLMRLGKIEIPQNLSFFLGGFYLLFIVAYVIWAAHFFMGFPFLFSLETEFILLFTVGAVLIFVVYGIKCFRERQLEKKFGEIKRCPHCRHVISIPLALECPNCRRTLDG